MLTLASAGLINDSANAQTFNLPVADSGGGLTKTGNGLITLFGHNTYTGPTVVNAVEHLSFRVSVRQSRAWSAGRDAALTVSASIWSPYYLLLGNVSGSAGAVYQSGDTIST